MLHLICFGDKKFDESKKMLQESALKYGVDKVHAYGENDLKNTIFYKENIQIFRQERGFGFWLWKPYFIKKTMDSLENGDLLFYCDCGVEILSSLQPFLDLLKHNDVLSFKVHNHLNQHWTKRDVFLTMDCDHEPYLSAEQRAGGFIFFKVNDFTRQFVAEWLTYCTSDQLITDAPIQLGKENYPDFQQNRHDQSIFTNLCIKYNIIALRDPSQKGEPFAKAGDSFGTVFNLHRTRKHSLYFQIMEYYVRPMYLMVKKWV